MSDQATFFANASEVLGLFLIPIGGGIPAGVVVAKGYNFTWPFTASLYLISDILLAFVIEYLMHLFIAKAKNSQFLIQFIAQYKLLLQKTGISFGLTKNPLSLIAISFGVDPITGRVAARAAGHGFITGWAIAICGDMIFFALIMASTLWLDNIIGDGTWAAWIMTAIMFGGLILYERWKMRRRSP